MPRHDAYISLPGASAVTVDNATVPGITHSFSGHHDTWYDRVMDNGSANVASPCHCTRPPAIASAVSLIASAVSVIASAATRSAGHH